MSNGEATCIGYIMGSGDEVADGLRHLGYDVTPLSDDDLESGDLSRFDAIVAGIRAYNTRERLAIVQPRLLQYVEEGGTLIVQYNVSRGLVTEDIGPYPFTIGRDRVSEEDAPVTILAPDHQLLRFPNTITQEILTAGCRNEACISPPSGMTDTKPSWRLMTRRNRTRPAAFCSRVTVTACSSTPGFPGSANCRRACREPIGSSRI